MDDEENILIQNELCRLGIVNAICEIIVQNDDVELQNECIDLGMRVLDGGNAKVQEAFCDYIQSDAQNGFMLTIKNLIEKSLNLIKETSLNYKARLDGLDEKEAESAGKNIMLNVNLYEGSFISKEFEGENESSTHAQNALELLGSIYRIFQLFCEGHYLEMQNLLREQTDKKGNVKGKSQDFISITPYYFNTLVKQINPDSIDTATQILCFLMESMQGPCEENQLALTKANIINFCLDFLTNFKGECDYKKRGFTNRDEINRLIIMTIRTLDTLIEGSHNLEIIEAIGTLDFEVLLFRLAIEYKTFVEEGLHLNVNTVSPSEVTLKLTNNHFFKYLFESFYVYIFIANLTELYPHFVENPENYSALEQDALEFFKLNVGDVEIMFKGKLLKVYFPKYPAVRYLSRDIRENLMTNVNRETPHDKIKSFVKAAPELLEEIRTGYMLQNLPIALNKRRYNLLRDFSTFLSLLINIIILCVSYYKVENNISLKMTEDIGELSSEQAINILGYIQLITSSLMLLFWIIMNVPIILRKKWRQCSETHKARSPKNHILAGIDKNTPASELPLSVAVELLLRNGSSMDMNNGHLYVYLLYCWKSIFFIISDERFIFSVFYLVVSILGLAVSEISYCLHLLDIINRFDALKTIVRSVTHNLYQLLLTSMLGVILIYIYSLVGFYFIDEMYYNSDVGPVGERSCTSMFHCYITTLNYGLRNGGGIGDVLAFQSYETSNRIPYFFRLVFDFSFFVIINVIFLNIILGIIVDAFAGRKFDSPSLLI